MLRGDGHDGGCHAGGAADLVLFNTCCVRDNAERRALGNVTWLKELKQDKPELLIGVCGCMIQQPGMAEKILKQYQFIDLAFGTANLHRLPQLLYEELTTHAPGGGGRSRSEDVIAEGLPVKRLRPDQRVHHHHVRLRQLLLLLHCALRARAGAEPWAWTRSCGRRRSFIASGVKEIMLLGQNVNSYGKGLPRRADLCTAASRGWMPVGIPRIRFMTSHPKDLSDELIAAMGECKHVCPQFHLPVQSGSDEILQAMNRHYDTGFVLGQGGEASPCGAGHRPDHGHHCGLSPGKPRHSSEDTLSLVKQVGL